MVTKVKGSSQLAVADYAELRALDSSKFADGQEIPVTGSGIAGRGTVKTGTVIDNDSTLIVFTDDSNRYWERTSPYYQDLTITNGITTNTSAYLNLKVKGLARDYGVQLFGAEEAGIVDESTKINAALSDKYIIEVEEGFAGISNIVIPNSKEIHGQHNTYSGFRVVGDNHGLQVRRFTNLMDLRVIGNASMAADKACVRIGTPATGDSARSNLIRLIVGGLSTEIGDSTNTKLPCVGIGGGNTFLNKFDSLYVHNVEYGYLNDRNSFGGGTFAGVNNALEFSNCEMHKCTIGLQMSRPNGVHFNQFTAENCTAQGMVLGTCWNVTGTNLYLEANNTNNLTGNPSADLLINPSLVGMGSEPGRCFVINGLNLLSGSSAYGIWVENQSNLNINGIFDQSATGGRSLITVSNASNGVTGSLDGYFSSGSATIDNASNRFFIINRSVETEVISASSGANSAVHATRTITAMDVVRVTISSDDTASNTNGSIEQYLVGAWENGTINVQTLMNSQQAASVGCIVQGTGTNYEYEVINRPAMATAYRPRIRIEKYKR